MTTMTKDERAAARAKAAKPAAKTTKVPAQAKPKTTAAVAGPAAKAVKKAGTKTKPSRIESQSETVRAIVALASRPQGATAKELEEASGWKNAGWPWMFFNKKTGKGIAPRYGMKFTVIDRPVAEGERPRKAYKLSPAA